VNAPREPIFGDRDTLRRAWRGCGDLSLGKSQTKRHRGGRFGAGLAMLIAVYTLGGLPIGWAPFAASFVEVAALILR
jgi:hypothetical protein